MTFPNTRIDDTFLIVIIFVNLSIECLQEPSKVCVHWMDICTQNNTTTIIDSMIESGIILSNGLGLVTPIQVYLRFETCNCLIVQLQEIAFLLQVLLETTINSVVYNFFF